jgi:hypothetical protein
MVGAMVFTGIILLILSVLIIWTDFVLRLIVGMVVILIAYIFFYLAYKMWALKKEVEKFFKLK